MRAGEAGVRPARASRGLRRARPCLAGVSVPEPRSGARSAGLTHPWRTGGPRLTTGRLRGTDTVIVAGCLFLFALLFFRLARAFSLVPGARWSGSACVSDRCLAEAETRVGGAPSPRLGGDRARSPFLGGDTPGDLFAHWQSCWKVRLPAPSGCCSSSRLPAYRGPGGSWARYLARMAARHPSRRCGAPRRWHRSSRPPFSGMPSAGRACRHTRIRRPRPPAPRAAMDRSPACRRSVPPSPRRWRRLFERDGRLMHARSMSGRHRHRSCPHGSSPRSSSRASPSSASGRTMVTVVDTLKPAASSWATASAMPLMICR